MAYRINLEMFCFFLKAYGLLLVTGSRPKTRSLSASNITYTRIARPTTITTVLSICCKILRSI